jgi:hypothetical protein
VINRENIDTNKPDAEERVVANPLVQAEFARQRRDLDEALHVNGENDVALVARLRDLAKAEAAIFFEASPVAGSDETRPCYGR